MHRIPTLLVVLLAACCAIPTSAHAQGVPFRGHNVVDSRPIVAVTGSCTCEINWYTVGVNPGTLRLTAVLKRYGSRLNVPSYAIRIFLYRGGQALQWTQAYCSIKQSTCGHTAHLTQRVTRPTIYYVKVEGPGAEGIQYSLQFQGPLRHLRCKTRCS